MNEIGESEALGESEEEHKRIAFKFFDLVIMGKFKEGLYFFAPNCITHNPYVSGGMDDLINAMELANREMAQKYPNAEFAVKQVLSEGNMVAVHTQLINDKSRPMEGGLRQAHLFRFDGDKIIEYWDITQQITPEMPNALGAF